MRKDPTPLCFLGVTVSISPSTLQLASLPGGQILNRGILKGYLGPATLKADSSGVRTLLPRTQFYQTARATPQLHALSELARSLRKGRDGWGKRKAERLTGGGLGEEGSGGKEARGSGEERE